jgi:hypothetical protein
MRNDIDADMGAAVAAVSLGWGDALYSDIRPGERFRFKGMPDGRSYVKLASGSYRDAADSKARCWRTGQRTAVFRVTN